MSTKEQAHTAAARPSKRAMEAAIDMEVHAALSTRTDAKALELDKRFPAYDDMLAVLKGLRRTIASMGGDLEVTAPESINANTYHDELARIDALLARATGAAK